MRRRKFLAALGGAAIVWPGPARAQPERPRRIGYLSVGSDSDAEYRSRSAAFQDGLGALGWAVGRSLQIDYRFGVTAEHTDTLARQLVELGPDVILGATAAPVLSLKAATTTIPIVFVQVVDPIELGLVASLAHPGGNLTGFANFEAAIGAKWLDIMKQIAPGVTRVGIMSDPGNPRAASVYTGAVEAAAPGMQVKAVRIGVRDAGEIERAIADFATPATSALIVLPAPVTMNNRALIVALAERHHLPAIYPYRAFAAAGGLVSYGIDAGDLYRRAASYVDRILRGEWPGDLPVQNPIKYEFVINVTTAKALGITMPQSLLVAADEVIE